jgi:hypothetical protein
MANSTDLSRFRARHEKLVIVHGVSDPILSVNDTIHWYEQLNQVNQGRAAEFVRMFAVPGMNHCVAARRRTSSTRLQLWPRQDRGDGGGGDSLARPH